MVRFAWLRSMAWCAAVALLGHSFAVRAVTGGIAADDVLAAASDQTYTRQQIALARSVSAVTVSLVNSDAGAYCSATIVHPRVVLTAAHCVLSTKGVSRKLTVRFERAASQRQALDVAVHPTVLKAAQRVLHRPLTQSLTQSIKAMGRSVISADLALVLLHRPIPEGYEVVMPVARGFRDSTAATKIIAGFGRTEKRAASGIPTLHFAELIGNSRLDAGGITGEDEIVMLSRYREGARVNVCSGDSGGPIFVLDRVAGRLRQLGVTSVADEDCREGSGFAPIDAQRNTLRELFDALMQGEEGADENPF